MKIIVTKIDRMKQPIQSWWKAIGFQIKNRPVWVENDKPKEGKGP